MGTLFVSTQTSLYNIFIIGCPVSVSLSLHQVKFLSLVILLHLCPPSPFATHQPSMPAIVPTIMYVTLHCCSCSPQLTFTWRHQLLCQPEDQPSCQSLIPLNLQGQGTLIIICSFHLHCNFEHYYMSRYFLFFCDTIICKDMIKLCFVPRIYF